MVLNVLLEVLFAIAIVWILYRQDRKIRKLGMVVISLSSVVVGMINVLGLTQAIDQNTEENGPDGNSDIPSGKN